MGKPQSTGNLINAISQDSSNNIGIGGAASGSFKFQVTGTTNLTGALTGTSATFSSLTLNSGNAVLNTYFQTGTSAGWDVNTFFTGGNTGAEVSLNLGYAGATTDTFIKRGSNGRLDLGTAATARLSIASTGAATFSSSVTAKTSINLIHSNSTAVFKVEEFSGTQGAGLSLFNSSGTQNVLFNAGGDSFIRGGNVGIGTSSPTNRLTISNNGNAAVAFRINDTNANASFLSLNASDSDAAIIAGGTSGIPFDIYTGGSQRMRITSAGNVGIGTSSPSEKLQVIGNIKVNGTSELTAAGSTSNFVVNNTLSAGSSSGTVGIYFGDVGSGINTITREKQSVNTSRTVIYSEQGYNVQSLGAFFQAGAAYQGNNSTTWAQISDVRIKENIRPISDSLDKILALSPCHFEYKTNLGKIKTGFIAQEFEQVLPGHVIESPVSEEYKKFIPEEGETIKSIDADLIPYLVKATQELKSEKDAEIAELRAQIEALKAIVATK